jgi:hypothetical protein
MALVIWLGFTVVLLCPLSKIPALHALIARNITCAAATASLNSITINSFVA